MDVSTIFGGLSYDMKIELASGPLTKELFDECNAYDDSNIFYPRRAYDHGDHRHHFLNDKEEEDKEACDDGNIFLLTKRRRKRPAMMTTVFY